MISNDWHPLKPTSNRIPVTIVPSGWKGSDPHLTAFAPVRCEPVLTHHFLFSRCDDTGAEVWGEMPSCCLHANQYAAYSGCIIVNPHEDHHIFHSLMGPDWLAFAALLWDFLTHAGLFVWYPEFGLILVFSCLSLLHHWDTSSIDTTHQHPHYFDNLAFLLVTFSSLFLFYFFVLLLHVPFVFICTSCFIASGSIVNRNSSQKCYAN